MMQQLHGTLLPILFRNETAVVSILLSIIILLLLLLFTLINNLICHVYSDHNIRYVL